ncbi:hypothetical protein CNR22_22070 [Sphingobacteriaceae bacterium]|nr:hypothetical protein CNR22_22070 [Sphingobacteriaceae bacterium]
MKSNDRLIIIATAAFTYLFYQQNAGINFLLFNLVFTSVLVYRDKSLLRQKPWILSATMCLISATGIVLNSSALAIITNCCGLLLLSAYSMNRTNSSILAFLFGCYSLVSSVIFAVTDAAIRSEKNKEKEKHVFSSYGFLSVFIVSLLCILFFVLYKQANPLFAANTEWINFNFISFSWLLFTTFAFFTVYGLFYSRKIKTVLDFEQGLKSLNEAADLQKESNFKTEISAGILLFLFLNFMLVILNSGDVNTIWFHKALPKGISHSDFVHDGVNMIVLSILIATALIMFLFRKNFQAIRNSKLLRFMVYAWIFQNLIMLFSTATRNQLYIHDYNFTYKRVGVYVWLILATVGLSITFYKILKERSNWFLISSNFTVWFAFLAISSVFNWDVLITRYNLKNKPLTEVDFNYLFSLSDANIPELLKVSQDKNFKLINGPLKNFKDLRVYQTQNHTGRTFKALMKMKIKYYLKDYKKEWQSWDLRDRDILNSINY